MAEDRWLELPEHVVVKIQKVLGISPTSLATHDLVRLIEDLCDTALMFEREEHGAEQPEEQKDLGVTTGGAATQPSTLPPDAEGAGPGQSPSGGV